MNNTPVGASDQGAQTTRPPFLTRREAQLSRGGDARVDDPTGQTVAFGIERLRNWKQMSREDLANELVRNGVEMTEHAIGRIERRQRRVTLGEFTAFAYALGVTPADILDPGPIRPALTGVPHGLDWDDYKAWLSGQSAADPRSLAAYWVTRWNNARLIHEYALMRLEHLAFDILKSRGQQEKLFVSLTKAVGLIDRELATSEANARRHLEEAGLGLGDAPLSVDVLDELGDEVQPEGLIPAEVNEALDLIGPAFWTWVDPDSYKRL